MPPSCCHQTHIVIRCVEQIIALIEEGRLLRVLEHPNRAKCPDQRLYEIDVDG